MTAKNGHPSTEWFSPLCLQTNHKHMEKQSLICTRNTSFYTRNTSFYTDNITSTLTKVVFSINWLRMFALYVCQMCCKLELKTMNRKTTASLWNHRKRHVCSDPCICTTQRYLFIFQRSFARNLKNISPIIWYCCNLWLIFCTKQTRKQSLLVLLTTSGTSHDLSWMISNSFSQLHGVFLFGNIERCIVVSFSGLT